MDISLQPARTEDEVDLAAFYKTCREHTDMPIVPDYFRALPDEVFTSRWSHVFARPDRHRALIASVDGKRAGFSILGPMDDGYSAAYLQNCALPEKCGELHQLYLLPEFQGLGLGRLLYERALQDSAGLGYAGFTLCTYRENLRAIGFYRAMGAEVLKEDTLYVNFSGQDWQRDVTFLLHHL